MCYNGPHVLDVLQVLDNILQYGIVIRILKEADRGMAGSDGLKIQAWSKKALT